MRQISKFALCVALAAFAMISAQAQMPAMKPAPELQKLNYFTGTWTLEGNMKPGPMGPGGPMTETEKNSWMDGNFFLVSNSDFKSQSMGNGTETAFMGYDTDKKMYTYDAFNSMGEAEHSTGMFDGTTWTWTSDEHMGGMTMKGKFVIKTISATSYTFEFDMSQDGNTWNTLMDGKATKVQ
jgi:hypothetical protein